MDVETYYELSKHPVIKAITTDGTVINMPIIKTERPPLREVCGVCTGKNGMVVFSETATIEASEKMTIDRIELYYGDEPVGSRRIPNLHMNIGDTLQVNYNVSISREAKQVRLSL
jgi:hypothetical protein